MQLESYKYLIVGAGLWGSVLAERIATVLEQPVLVIDKRDHTGGNCHSFFDKQTGIECHAYGTHIFHTSLPHVWRYITSFTDFTNYRHTVYTEYNGRLYHMPINLSTINAFYEINLRPHEVEHFIAEEAGKEYAGHMAANLEEKAIQLIGRPLYEAFIQGYTAKQWGKDPRELPADIITRLPVRSNYQTGYFNDPWQGLPVNGYAHLFDTLLSHPRIRVQLRTDYTEIASLINPDCTILYSGPIDALFDYAAGPLEWRSLHFEQSIEPYHDIQGTAVINQADVNIPYTRTHEYKHLHPERGRQGNESVLVTEYPKSFMPGDEPYYPVNTTENQKKLSRYQQMLKLHPQIIAGGRLGAYRYMDMDKTIDDALFVFSQLQQANNHRVSL